MTLTQNEQCQSITYCVTNFRASRLLQCGVAVRPPNIRLRRNNFRKDPISFEQCLAKQFPMEAWLLEVQNADVRFPIASFHIRNFPNQPLHEINPKSFSHILVCRHDAIVTLLEEHLVVSWLENMAGNAAKSSRPCRSQ